MSAPCFVYVIAIEGQKLAKVGISNNPRSRLDQLSTGSPFQMRLVHTYRFGARDRARKIESYVHEELADRRCNGEWFAVSSELALRATLTRIIRLFLWELEWDEESILAELVRIGIPHHHYQRLLQMQAAEAAQRGELLQ
jgi:hypothetical protein